MFWETYFVWWSRQSGVELLGAKRCDLALCKAERSEAELCNSVLSTIKRSGATWRFMRRCGEEYGSGAMTWRFVQTDAQGSDDSSLCKDCLICTAGSEATTWCCMRLGVV